MPLKPKEREYRNLVTLQPQIHKRIDSEYYVEGYAATWDRYLLYEFDGVEYYERIDKNAFDDADINDVIMQYDHQGKVLARTSNKTLILDIDDKGLLICADLGKSQAAREMYDEIDNELVTRMSWAFIVAEDSYDRETRTRTILKIKKVYDVSAVSIPANDGTEITARSYVDGVIDIEKQELLEQRRKQFVFETENMIILGGIK